MDKHLNNAEERLFELLESTDFDQLSKEDRAFVEQHLSRGDYELQRRMITEAEHAFPAPPLAKPLKFAPVRLMGRSIPLYQAILSVAATIALFLFLWPETSQPNEQPQSNPQQLVSADTVIQTKIVTDTVIRYIEREIIRNNTAAANPPETVIDAAPMRVWEAGAIELPAITEELVKTKGSSLQEDTASKTILNGIYVARAS